MLPLLTLGLAALASALPIHEPSEPVQCVSGLQIFVARGSNQPVGEGSLGVVADAIEARIPDSISTAVDYPAVIISSDGLYPASVREGIRNAKEQIEDYVNICGEGSRIALLGYSQGGNVMTDVLAGAGPFNEAPLEERFARNIVGTVAFGDPRHNSGEEYSRGTATTDGLFRRSRFSSLPRMRAFSDRFRSFCDQGDPFCARQLGDAHGQVVGRYTQEAVDFIVERAGA